MTRASKKAATRAKTSQYPRLRKLVPVIEGLPPDLRELVVQQVGALVNLVLLLESYTKRTTEPPEQPKARKSRGTKARRAATAS